MECEYYKNPLNRYYDIYTYSYDGEEYLLRVHHNNIIRDNLEIQSVKYLTQEAKISGKRKRGAEKVQPGSVIMTISTADRRFDIPACITAQFLEMNEKLVTNPSLVKDSEGFLGIFLVALDKVKKVLATLK